MQLIVMMKSTVLLVVFLAAFVLRTTARPRCRQRLSGLESQFSYTCTSSVIRNAFTYWQKNDLKYSVLMAATKLLYYFCSVAQ